MTRKTVRIGGASGFWGDSSVGAPQLVEQGNIDYLVFDYLAELTMSLLAGARLKNPQLGYATDFITSAMASVLPGVTKRGIRVIANAGGVNPKACAQALSQLASEMGVEVKVAVVLGDDALPLVDKLRAQGVGHMDNKTPIPSALVSANAYLGAMPIAQALDAGAQIVITGRCVDSAVTLGALIHEFGWQASDWDQLAGGSLAGHIIECGCQATGGLHTDWEKVPDWSNIGYPIVECAKDGSFVVSKPSGTGGLINRATIAEQLLYEIGDPAAYLLPDVVCDFCGVRIEDAGHNLVTVSGAKGRPPSDLYKVTATYESGFRCNADLLIIGIDATAKAQRSGEAMLERTRRLFKEKGFDDFTATHIDVLGAEQCYGPHATLQPPRQAVLRVAVTHSQKAALVIFSKEIAAAGTSWAPGTAGLIGGRPSVSLSIRQFPMLISKKLFSPVILMDGQVMALKSEQNPQMEAAIEKDKQTLPKCHGVSKRSANDTTQNTHMIEVPLIRLAYARSGDKGDTSNIGILARHANYLPTLYEQLTPVSVKKYLAHLVHGPVTRFELPGIGALNFVCEEALDGGGMSSLRTDPLGKSMAQILLSMPIKVDENLLNSI